MKDVSGHSKWHNIKLRKSKMDAIKGKLFTKVAREIIIAVRQGGADPEGNFRLKLAILNAKEVNMPKDNIERAIAKGLGSESEAQQLEEIVYEGYGPGGVAIMIEITTDNRNRTVPELRNIFSKHGGSLGESGCVGWMFDKKGFIAFDSRSVKEEELLAVVLEAGAEDMRQEEDMLEVVTSPLDFQKVKEAIDQAGFKPATAEIVMIPKVTVKVSNKDAPQLLKLMETLENHDDIQKVYANFDIDSKVMEELSKA